MFSAGGKLGSWNLVAYKDEAEVRSKLSTMIGRNCRKRSCGNAKWNLRPCSIAVIKSFRVVLMVSQQLAQYRNLASLSIFETKMYAFSKKSGFQA